MKTKLLIKLCQIGRNKIDVVSVTTTNGVVTGMSLSFNEKEYRHIWEFGDTELDVKEKASKIYLQTNIENIRKKYAKYRKIKQKRLLSSIRNIWENCKKVESPLYELSNQIEF